MGSQRKRLRRVGISGMASSMPISNEVFAKAENIAKDIEADVYFYNGGVSRRRDLDCVQCVHGHKGRDKAILIPVTNGGDPDAGFKITRYFQDRYDSFTVLVSGMCKSAGTLMAIGAHELAFTPFGELGPLDIQLSKVDRFETESGLSIQDALDTLEDRAKLSFYKMTQDYVRANNGLLSFAMASKAASDFVTQLYAPILSRIDPEEVGARSRSMRIAVEYGKRLAIKSRNLKPDALEKLAETYSSHSFVIDMMEASLLFERVREASAKEKELVAALGSAARFQRSAASDFVFRALSTSLKAKKEAPNAKADRRGSASQNGRNPARTEGKAGSATERRGRGRAQPVPKRARASLNGTARSPA